MNVISVVIPVYNERKNISYLCKEITSVFKKLNKNYEIIFINDGSRDATQEEIEKIFKKDPKHIRGIQFRNNFGKAAALHAGFQMARGEIIFTMDGDMQDDSNEIPKFLAKLKEGYDLISGWKIKRKDSFIKNKTSMFFNYTTNLISKVELHDYNCGFKLYRAEAAKGLNLYGELHRYIPVIVASQGYRVTEIPVNHRVRKFGSTKYGPIRFIHGFLDLVTVLFITKFRARPLHLFGYLGILFFTLGFFIGLYLTITKIFQQQAIGERPLLLFSVMLLIMGVQVGITGIVGEHITALMHKNEPSYQIKKVIK